MEALLSGLKGRPSLLLHSCCGPCSSAVLETLTPYFAVSVYFYNPNIRPRAEFERRLHWQRVLLERAPFAAGVELLVPEREEEAFSALAAGREEEPEGGGRCADCFALRLARTAEAARAGGFAYFATTLTVSPHKNAPLINAIGEALGAERGVSWLSADFKKRDGYRRSVALSREYGLYRQAWCGCAPPEEMNAEEKEPMTP